MKIKTITWSWRRSWNIVNTSQAASLWTMHVTSMRSSDPARFSRALKHFLAFKKKKPNKKEKKNPTSKQTGSYFAAICVICLQCVVLDLKKNLPSIHRIYSSVAFSMRGKKSPWIIGQVLDYIRSPWFVQLIQLKFQLLLANHSWWRLLKYLTLLVALLAADPWKSQMTLKDIGFCKGGCGSYTCVLTSWEDL